jgi:hypothetical protein
MTTATSEIQICNAALALLGEPQIASLSSDSEAARQCNLLYSKSRNAVLRNHPWNFAETYAVLNLLTEVPPFEYAHYYQLPTDCIRALRLVDTSEPWRVVANRRIMTDANPCNLVYTAEIVEVERFDPLFVQAVSYHLAASMAIILPNKANLHQQLMGMYENIIRQAKTADGQEGTPIAVTYSNSWRKARSTWNNNDPTRV